MKETIGAYVTVGCFILFDILTGLLKALYMGDIDSTALRKGLFHKLSEVLAVAGAVLLEYGMNYINLGVDLPIFGVVSVYICITELTSILENLCEVNPILGNLFKPYLQKLKEKEAKENDFDDEAKRERDKNT